MNPPVAADLYAPPRLGLALEDCVFYHTMDLPGVGLVRGDWDLREGIEDYLGGVELHGRRVLDVGAASGFLSFEMEKRGAEVVGYDLSDEGPSWDLVPYRGAPHVSDERERVRALRMLNNGYWFAHERLDSHARIVYGSVYEVPDAIGPVDVATFGCILLHLRDPFLALERVLRLTRQWVVVTEPAPRMARVASRLPSWTQPYLAESRLVPAGIEFMPNAATGIPRETWWRLAPWGVGRMLGVLGFAVRSVRYHSKIFGHDPYPLYTIVAERNPGLAVPVMRGD